jgi:PAS domain S-box-containing protein
VYHVTRKLAVTRRSAGLVLAISLGMSALAGFSAAYWCKSHNETLKAQRFDVLTQEAADKIRRQFQLYEFGLRGARGAIIAAGNELSRERFERYSQTRDVETEFPGSLGFGFIRIVPKTFIGEFLESASRDGSPDFEIRELGEHPGDHFVIQYIEPSKSNTEAIGLDVASELMRRDAALASMDSGEARLTAPLTLVQASGKSERGFLFLLPIYQAGQPIDTAEGRRAAALGWSYTPLLIDDVLAGAQFLGDELTLSLSDIRTAGSSPFYSSTVAEPVEDLSRRIWLNVYGRDWELGTQASPVFLKGLNLENPVLVGIGVFLFGLLLSVVFHLHLKELRRRERDWSERSRLASMVEESSEAIVGTNLNGEVTDWNPAAEQLFGYKAAEVLGRRLESLIVPARLVPERDDALRQVFQGNSCVKLVTQRQSRDGRLMDMEVNLSPIRSETGTLVGIGTSARDITPFVKAQREFQELNQSLEKQIVARTAELNAITNAIPSMIAYWDKNLLCRFANAAYLEWFGREPQELIGSSMVSLLGERLFAMNEPHIRAALRGRRRISSAAWSRPTERPATHGQTTFHILTSSARSSASSSL